MYHVQVVHPAVIKGQRPQVMKGQKPPTGYKRTEATDRL